MNYYGFPNFTEKSAKKENTFPSGTLEFPGITPQPSDTIHVSLGFAPGTLSCFLF